MNTPIVATTAASLTTVQVAEAISWLANGCPAPIPSDVSFALAAGVIVCGHVAYQWLTRRLGVPPVAEASPPAQPAN